ncbi:CheY-specific phosphatase CheX [Herbaspirillum sp. Sphag1AN]|uniref:chemotaxis protein CheX n=1 Tax=unclassified Herbaspirillum TaxID=2624150 RepID=UPI00160DEC54|nr:MULTISPECIES: chemotaxis protein CheX [unclassified Herbaspirillum]MBB3212572.1 CheY-specific phosphatase CheX [Herbaspirillum sp. Sphag1AN]MBB3245769.1 CheY-specific phosphatase CheX [Herbaspirillum sp. Sphag64]
MSLSSSDIHKTIEIVASDAQKYLKSTHRIQCVAQPAVSGKADALALRDVTAIIGLGGAISNLVTVSFDHALLAYLLKQEMEGLVVPPEEHDLYMNEAAAEISNVILGHCLAYLEDMMANRLDAEGGRISMSPPVVIQNVGSMHQAHSAAYTSVALVTDFGYLVLSIIWPYALFEKVSNGLKARGKST